MQLESHATPFGGTPQQRYASLHRAIEQGLDSDDVWLELASVSAKMGHHDEARRCVARMQDTARRAKAERSILTAAGIASQSSANTPPPEPRVGRRSPAAAPAASNAGSTKRNGALDRVDTAPGVVDHMVDACQYLLHQHMPWLVLTTMLAFPLIVGVGGILTAGDSPLLLAAIAALPGLTVMVIVAAMGHEILRSSSDGEGDVPDLPEFHKLVRYARNFLTDAALVALIFFACPVVLVATGAPWAAMIPSIAVGAFFAPLAFALRQIRRDMRTFSPVFLLRAARRCGRGYALVALAVTIAFVPAAVAASAVITHAIWVQIAVIGPLCVLPTFGATRLLGTWLDTHRESLGYLMTNPQQAKSSKQNTAAAAAAAKPTKPRTLRRPAALEQFQAPRVATTQRKGSPPPAVRPASAFAEKPSARPAPRAIEGRRPSAPEARRPSATPRPNKGLQDAPDLGSMPGAVVVSGSERARQGAASRRP